jgi:hypothetical protein
VARDSFVARNLPERDLSGLFESGIFDGGQRTVPNGCHVVEVEIDAGSRGTSRHTARLAIDPDIVAIVPSRLPVFSSSTGSLQSFFLSLHCYHSGNSR